MKQDLETNLYECIDTELNEKIAHALYETKLQTPKYKKLCDEEEKLLYENPKLRSLVDDFQDVSLTKKECKILNDIRQIRMEKDNYEEREIFFLGYREAFLIMRRLRLLIEEDS